MWKLFCHWNRHRKRWKFYHISKWHWPSPIFTSHLRFSELRGVDLVLHPLTFIFHEKLDDAIDKVICIYFRHHVPLTLLSIQSSNVYLISLVSCSELLPSNSYTQSVLRADWRDSSIWKYSQKKSQVRMEFDKNEICKSMSSSSCDFNSAHDGMHQH